MGNVDPILGEVAGGTYYDEIVARLAEIDKGTVPTTGTRIGREVPVNREAAKIVLDRMIADAGVELWLGAAFVDSLVEEGKSLLTVTEFGMGKRTDFEDFREMKHRGGKGVTCHKLTDKSGKLAAIQTVSEDDDVMMITDKGTIIRMSVSDINLYSRTAGGVIVMRTSEENRIITLTRLDKIEEIESEESKINEENSKLESQNATPEIERAPLTDGDEE